VISSPRPQQKGFPDLLEWGRVASPDEETWFDLKDLDDFESTDFASLLLPPWDRIVPDMFSFQPRVERASAERQPRPTITPDRKNATLFKSGPPIKKRRIDTSSLYTAVPQAC
jgi:hypothetical protein